MPSAAAPIRPLSEVLVELKAKGLRRGSAGAAGAAGYARRALPTGQPALDAALRTGGLPRGSLTLIDAQRGVGSTTLALGVLAAAQGAGGLAAYVDLEGTLDPAVAARLGVQLEWLLVVRPDSAAEAVEIAGWLGRSGLIDALVLDVHGADGARGAGVGAAVGRLAALVSRSTTTSCLVLAERRLRDTLAPNAAIRVVLERRAWLAIGRDLVGQRVEATVARHRWAHPGGTTTLDLWFAEGRRIDRFAHELAAVRMLPVTRHAGREVETVSA